MPRNENRVLLNVRVDKETKQGVQRIAGMLGVPECDLVQRVLDREIKRATERNINGR